MNSASNAKHISVVSDKVVGIQFLRALAATTVVLSHLFTRLANKNMIEPVFVQMIWVLGEYGVHIFFAVSGYVIFYASRNHFQGSVTGSWIFLAKRLIRIYPLYFITTLVYLFFAYLTKAQVSDPIDVIRSLFFVPYVNNVGLIMPVYTLGWTLNYEMFFYIVFALILMISKKYAIPTLIMTFSALCLLGTFYVWPQDSDPFFTFAKFYTNPVLMFFMAGLLSIYIKETPLEKAVYANNTVTLLISIAFFFLGMVFSSWLWASSLCVFFFFRASTRIDYMRLMPTLLTRNIQAVGDASYSLYLTHSFFLGFIVIGVSKYIYAPAIAVPVCVLLSLAVCLPAAIGCYRFIERPLLERGANWLKSLTSRYQS